VFWTDGTYGVQSPSVVAAGEQQFAVVTSARLRRFAGMIVAGTLCLYAILFVNVGERIRRGYPDFTVYYTAGTILRDALGHQLYDEYVQQEVQSRFAGKIPSRRAPLPYIHPPYEALLFVPLTRLPYSKAFAVWDLLNAAALFGVYLILRSSVAWLGSFSALEFVFASVAFFPVFACFLQGQDSVLLLLLCVLAFRAMKRNNDFLAGCWFGLGLFKFQFVVPMILLIAIWKSRRVLLGFTAVSMVLVGVSTCLTGWSPLLAYPHYVLDIASTPTLGGVPARFLPNLRGLVMGWHLPFPVWVGTGVAALISVAVFLSAATRQTRSDGAGLDLQMSLAVTVAALVGWQTNIHDLSLLVLPLVLSANYCFPTFAHKSANRCGIVFPAATLLLGPLWIVLWLVLAQVNAMALPVLWWTWEIGKSLSHQVCSADGVHSSV
jgi:hypothetical protein